MGSQTKGGASAPLNVLPFPQTARALRHYHTGMGAAGICALRTFDMAAPANVELFDDHRPGPSMERSPELALFLALYSTLNVGQCNDIRLALKRLCRDGDGPAARTALDLLEWATRPKIEKLHGGCLP